MQLPPGLPVTEQLQPGWHYPLGPGLVLRTRWRAPVSSPGERVLLIHPGRAFPPSHPATRLCLDLLKEAVAARAVETFLDVGCGSGILAVAAAALGAKQVLAVDLAWEAVRVTRNNAQENELAALIQALQGSTECLRGPFDLIAANLHVQVQEAKVEEFHRLTGPQGRLILGGFRDRQEDGLLARYQERGWRLQRRVVRDFTHPTLPPDLSFTWVAWLLHRHPGATRFPLTEQR